MIKISYYNGNMIINLNRFFPSTQKDLKKLMKVVKMDFDNRESIIDEIIKHLENRLKIEWDYSVRDKLERNLRTVKEMIK